MTHCDDCCNCPLPSRRMARNICVHEHQGCLAAVELRQSPRPVMVIAKATAVTEMAELGSGDCIGSHEIAPRSGGRISVQEDCSS
mmetsp:Transcript_14937/g.30030  ORF Transcript_14937/g.30030 Transcript_14937/m.30030 type:complete len:85 (-) Transcript_14937:105-359(-)